MPTIKDPKSYTEAEMAAIYDEAVQAGIAAGSTVEVTPMIVGQAKDLLSNEIDYTKKTYFVESGVCGFAYVHVKPATSRFARWLVKTEKARKDSYMGGVYINIWDYNQSLTRKEAHAQAMARKLAEYGIDAWASSRMD